MSIAGVLLESFESLDLPISIDSDSNWLLGSRRSAEFDVRLSASCKC